MSNAIDLSTLPPEIRQKVEQQLAKLPPGAREKILREGGPVIRKLVGKVQAAGGRPVPPPLPRSGAGTHATSHAPQSAAAAATAVRERATEAARQVARLLPKGHYTETIRPGDRPGSGRWLLIVLVAAMLMAAFWDLSGDGIESDAGDQPVEIEAG